MTHVKPDWIAPVLALAWSAIAFGVLWSTERYDDFAGWAAVVAVSHALMWLGLRGDPSATPSRGERVAIGLGGAMPTAAWIATLIPWFAGDGGMSSLGIVVMMIVFGIPLGVVVTAVVLFRLARTSRRVALQRIVAIVGATVVVAWALAIAWGQTGARDAEQALVLLVFPGLATWWLVPPIVWLLARR